MARSGHAIIMGVLSGARVWHARHNRMIDIKEFRKGLGFDDDELAVIARNSGIGSTRLAMAEQGLVTLNSDEESQLRMSINYALHCRKIKLLAKLGQGHFDDAVPMTWDEYQKQNQGRDLPKTMHVMTIRVELSVIDGRSYFPVSEPIPWNVELNEGLTKLLTTCPEVLESMISGIRNAVALHRQ